MEKNFAHYIQTLNSEKKHRTNHYHINEYSFTELNTRFMFPQKCIYNSTSIYNSMRIHFLSRSNFCQELLSSRLSLIEFKTKNTKTMTRIHCIFMDSFIEDPGEDTKLPFLDLLYHMVLDCCHSLS